MNRLEVIKMSTTELRYGENPHQAATSTTTDRYVGPTILGEPLHGKPMSYNNILDANAVLEVMLDMADETAAIGVKHHNPCCFAISDNLAEAVEHAWYGDEISAFGSVFGLTQPATLEAVQALRGRFVEVLIAPSFNEDALEWIRSPEAKKKNLRVIATGDLHDPPSFNEKRYIRGGCVEQSSDNKLYLGGIDDLFGEPKQIEEPNTGQSYTVGNVSDSKFSDSMKGLVRFGIVAAKHTKSNAIVLVYEHSPGQYRVLGMGAGQPNRKDAGEKLAVPKAQENLLRQWARTTDFTYEEISDHHAGSPQFQEEMRTYQRGIFGSDKVVAVSGAFFPFRDGVDGLINHGVGYIVSPGGSKNDGEVIAAANEQKVALIHTGVRHFRH